MGLLWACPLAPPYVASTVDCRFVAHRGPSVWLVATCSRTSRTDTLRVAGPLETQAVANGQCSVSVDGITHFHIPRLLGAQPDPVHADASLSTSPPPPEFAALVHP